MALLLLLAFVIGALTVVALEVAGLWILIRRLNLKVKREQTKSNTTPSVSFPVDHNPSLSDKQGALWVLQPDKVPKSGLQDKKTTEQKKGKDFVEVTPIRKYARIRDQHLILMESDDSSVEISLKGCTVVAVSATSLSSRKWAKKYPIKVESKKLAIYKGSNIIYIYLETSWEKESWCKALRLASYDDEEKITWFSKLSLEFHYYLASLNAGYPSFMKPSAGQSSVLNDKSVKLDNPSSKVRQFLKKLTKKASKSGLDYKASGISVSGREERKLSEKSHSFQDLMDTKGKFPNTFDDTSMGPSISTSTEPGLSESDSNHNNFDEGTLCLNLLISRLFFDVKNNPQIMSSLHSRIQRALSNIRIPNYIGEVTCKAVDPGTIPPRILAARVLPSDMNEVWSLEIDVEYLGGMLLDFETRLEIRELEFEGEETRFQVNTDNEVTSDLLESFEYLGKQLNLSEDITSDTKQKDAGYNDTDETEILKSTANASSQGSRWKSILHSIKKQVSQVSLSLGIRISSLSGTIRLCMKPPPSDQIWFGFTSMPDIQFDLESFVGDHKITNGHLALFLISRIKAGIRDTLVLPNSESVGIPWMLAEKDDWVPRKAAPFMWYKIDQDSVSASTKRQDSVSTSTKREAPSFQPVEVTHAIEENLRNPTKSEVNRGGCIPEVACESLDRSASSSSSIVDSTSKSSSFQELGAPLLDKDKMQEFGSRSSEDNNNKQDIWWHSPSRVFTEGQNYNGEDDETRSRRIGTRERMRGLGKKVGEKLDVKRRTIEEKGRSFVERMRGP